MEGINTENVSMVGGNIVSSNKRTQGIALPEG
jgi:hypothetical protein